jgi:subtilisin family serine protease
MQRVLAYICQINFNKRPMKFKNLLIIFGLFFGIQVSGQIAPDTYYIQFTDKNNSPYSINNPEEFLTQRAIDRRTKQGIPIAENDIPVNISYLQGVGETGANLLFQTRWLNGVTAETSDTSVITEIMNLPYVEYTLKMIETPDSSEKQFFEKEIVSDELISSGLKSARMENELDYGYSYFQINQINGIPLHNSGFTGESIVIAVLDGGFDGADVHPVFDSLWADSRVLGTKDFVHVGGDVFTESQHGKMVLSDMAANIPGEMIGTAPMASYWLLRSEYVLSENLIEEYNWVSAAEFADSVGADVINSSLSYVDYDMPQWSHGYEDMNGITCISTIGADIAVSKGIFVCNSAGNSGNDSFPWNGAPADGFNVFSVGALNDDGQRASFSSIGPTADGRIKPNIMALGQSAAIAVGDDGIASGSGTSFASPIFAGMVACLIQANPNMKVQQIQAAILESASNADSPDNYIGWGTPDFELANALMTTVEQISGSTGFVKCWPNPFTNDFTLQLNTSTASSVKVELINSAGIVVYTYTTDNIQANSKLTFEKSFTNFANGLYLLKVTADEFVDIQRLIKQ